MRDDGKRIAGPERIVEERKAGEPVDLAAKRALPKLFAALKLSELSAVREAATPPVKVDPVTPEVKPIVDGRECLMPEWSSFHHRLRRQPSSRRSSRWES